jgi:hypothetical protein
MKMSKRLAIPNASIHVSVEGNPPYRFPFRFCLPSELDLRARAAAPWPPEANRTALRTLTTSPVPAPSPPASLLSFFADEPPFPICLMRAIFALLSASTGFSIGSNWGAKVMSTYGEVTEENGGRVPCALPRAVFSRRLARGQIYPYSPCLSASSPASGQYPSSACPCPRPQPAWRSAFAGARSSLCVPSASHGPPSPNHNPRLGTISTDVRKDRVRTRNVPALAGTSCSHCVSASRFLPFHPQRGTHDCRSSSHIFLSRRWDWIPLARAKRSHFVGGLGLGRGLVRGRCVVGGGSWARGPSEEVKAGRLKSAASRS